MKHPDKKIMKLAIDFTTKYDTVCAIIVKDGKIIAKTGGVIFTHNDSTGHSEINAIRKASKKLKTRYLEGCWLYATFEPCPMCASACVWAKFEGIVYGANMNDRTKIYTQRVLIRCKDVLKHGTPKVKLHENFMRKEAKLTLK